MSIIQRSIREGSQMGGLTGLLYGLIAYLVFFFTFLYAIGFVEGLVVPKAVDTGMVGPMTEALIVNLLLMSLFAIQHSVMARKTFKRWWTQLVPESVERSTYVLFASLALVLLFWQWRPLPEVVWHVADPQIAGAIVGVSFFGWYGRYNGFVELALYVVIFWMLTQLYWRRPERLKEIFYAIAAASIRSVRVASTGTANM